MKKLSVFFACAAAMMALASCNKENLPSVPSQQSDKVRCVFSLSNMGDPMTKATGIESEAAGAAAEKTVNSLQVYIFNSSGAVIASGKVANAKTISMEVNSGNGYSIYAVCNATDWTSSIATVSDLEAKTADNLAQSNAASNFVMVGKLTNQSISKENNSFTVEVARRAAKVVLRKITNSLPEVNGAISLKGIYVSNVATVSNLFSDALPSDAGWVNKFGTYADLSAYTHFADKLATAANIANGEAYETAHGFYAAANPTETDSSEKTWSARFTRLVVAVEIQGVEYYYPISFNKELPELTANKYIDITNLNIKHLGSNDPDTPVSSDEISISVTVKDWDYTSTSIEM